MKWHLVIKAACIAFSNVGDTVFLVASSVYSVIFVGSMTSFSLCRGQSETLTYVAMCGVLTGSVLLRTCECATVSALTTPHTFWSGTLLCCTAGCYADIIHQLIFFSFSSTALPWETVKLQWWQVHPPPYNFPLCICHPQCHWAWDSPSFFCQEHKCNLHLLDLSSVLPSAPGLDSDGSSGRTAILSVLCVGVLYAGVCPWHRLRKMVLQCGAKLLLWWESAAAADLKYLPCMVRQQSGI